ncbi:DUF2252 family protein [Bradyrhizobium sp. USDA 4353]
MSIIEDTELYETWLRTQCKVVDEDLDAKHRRMREDPFVFLRATYYRWARRIERIVPEIAEAPATLCVGDIHLENFGTWRDADGRWVWGVNDFDEAAIMPYAFDLVRLATSAKLAPKMAISGGDAADAILEGYRDGLKTPRPALLDEDAIWIRAYVKCTDHRRRKFWDDIDALGHAKSLPEQVRQLLVASLPEGAENPKFRRRVAGGGSLGRPRFVVVANWRGGHVVREAKALVPSAWEWKREAPQQTMPRSSFMDLSTGLYRAPDPSLGVHPTADGDYLIRRLSADSRKIDLGKDGGADLEREQLRAMGIDLASIHAAHGDAATHIAADLKRREPGWLRRAAHAARDATEKDYEVWRYNG